MSDFLLLGGIALGVLSVIIAVIQLLQTRPPRAAAITLVLAIAAILAGGWLAPQPFRLSHICDAWTRVSGGQVAPAADPAPVEEPAPAGEAAPAEDPAAEDAPAEQAPAGDAPAADTAPADTAPAEAGATDT